MMTIKVTKAKNIFEATRGLTGKTEIEPLLLQTRFGIHTFGMRVPIDVVILNSKHEIVTVKENLKPNRIFFWKPIYNSVLELPEGTIQRLNLKKHAKLQLTTHKSSMVQYSHVS